MGLMCFSWGYMFTFLHAEGLNQASIIGKGNILATLAYSDRSDSDFIVTQNRNPFLFSCNIPNFEIANLVTS